jgi:hypothetical protein
MTRVYSIADTASHKEIDFMQRPIIYLLAVVGGAAFLFMVKLMYDMTRHMARMTDQVAVMSTDMGRVRSQMETLVQRVSGMEASVRHMPAMAGDVRGIRESIQTMAGVFQKGGRQIERLNPMDMMQQVLPPGQQR